MDWLVSQPIRLDQFLSEQKGMISRVRAQKAIEEGRVMVNEVVIDKPAHRLQEGDRVKLTGEDVMRASTLEPTDLQLRVLYEDDRCFVIDKPPGYAVHPGNGMPDGEITILHGIAFLFKKRSLPFSPDGVLVHRLDKETTGCMLVAKDPEAHNLLQRQFEHRTVRKFYLALAAGVPSPAEAVIDSPIGRSVSNRTMMGVMGTSAPRDAKTTYVTVGVSTERDASLLLCELHTGRTHQVRVHLSAIGHPILGDGTYSSALSERVVQNYDVRFLCLHAWKLAFMSPGDNHVHEVVAPLPPQFSTLLERMGISLSA